MKILLEHKTPLDLEPKFEVNIEKMNPLLSEQGSSSLPLNLPPTKNNISHLGYPNRLDRLYKIKKKTPVLLEQGIMRKQAMLEVMSYQQTDGIEAVLLLDEAEMYTKMQEVSLPGIFKTIRKAEDLQLEGTFETPLDKMIKYLELVYLDQIQDDFRLFTVATDYRTETSTVGRDKRTLQKDVYSCLNLQKEEPTRNYSGVLDFDLNGNKYSVFHGRTENIVTSGSEKYNVPKGYGITPFLKESYVLREIFKYFGYELETSTLDTDPDLKLLVLLNNTADAIVKAQIDYSQLVPTCTIHEYLQTVRQRFGCEFYVTEDHKRVVPIFWRNIFDTKPKKSYSGKIADEPKIEFMTPKQIRLCYKRNLEFANIADDTLEKFESTHTKIIGALEKAPPVDTPLADGLYYIRNTRTIQEYYTYYDEYNKCYRQKWRFVVRNIFDYYIEATEADYEEPESNLEYLPEMGVFGDNTRVDPVYSEGPRPIGPLHIDYPYTWVIFIGERRHMNTTLQVTTTDENGKTETKDKKESTGECPIMAAFARKGLRLYSRYGQIHTYGTMFCYDLEGKKVGNIDLTFGGENGLYNNFWKERDSMLQHSNHKVTADIMLNEHDIINFRMDELVEIDGQMFLPEKLQYSIRKDRMETNQAEFRTVRLYKDTQ